MLVLVQYLTPEMVQFKEEVNNWEDAIRVAAEPLLKQQFIEAQYIDTMIENVKLFGPYVVILPGFAMPHARPENGVNQLGLSLLVLKNSVPFDSEKSANAFLVLAAPDPDSHLTLLSELSTILSSNERLQALLSAKNYQEVAALLKEEAK